MIERIRLADFELRASPLLPEPPLLITESRTEFDRIHQALNDDIRPRGITQKMYVADIAFHTWDIARMRRCKVTLINSQFRAALASLLDRLLRQSGDPQPGDWLHAPNAEAENLAEAWFTKPAAKKRVAELLGNFRLDANLARGGWMASRLLRQLFGRARNNRQRPAQHRAIGAGLWQLPG